jgi:hypothetical protein
MPGIHLNGTDPLALSLAADMRHSHPDFTNDQIWELRMLGGEPPALVLQTTYGLRAHWMRIFPRFIYKDRTYSDPSQFHTAPQVHAVYPDYVRLSCSPFNGLDVQIEYRVSSSQGVCCRTQLKNTTILKAALRLEWAALLSPLEDGIGMSPIIGAGSCYLTGSSGGLAPVLVMEGCSMSGLGSYPTLAIDIDLYPGNVRFLTWASVALEEESRSLELARQVLKTSWEGQVARIELQNSSQLVEFHTGREDWDAALNLSQISASSLFMPAGGGLPAPSFILTRQPDQGYSFRGDGSDYSPPWRGQTALDALYMASLILPARVDLVKGLVENFLSTQDEHGWVDWRPNLAGQRSRYMAQPVLAALAWQAATYLDEDAAGWLAGLYPGLLRFLKAWFSPELDRDQDGFPEWEHVQQTGLEDLPLFNQWHPEALGVNIHLVEAPGLAALLFRECQSLARIAQKIGKAEDLDWLEARMAGLKAALDKNWEAKSGLFRYRDTFSHVSQDGGQLKSWRGSGKYALKRTFKVPQRLQFHLAPFEENTRAITVRLTGQGEAGEQVEEIAPRQWTWVLNQARVTSQSLFKAITLVEIEGADPNDVLTLRRVDHQQADISLLLPLWAGLPTGAQAKKMVENALMGSFHRPFGAPLCAQTSSPASSANLNGVSPLWINLVGEGLIHYEYRAEAVELISRTLDAISGTLKRTSSFREYYDADSGQPTGERNHLRGLAPAGLFLKLLGIQKLTSKEIILSEFNPFPSQVTVKYRGMTIVCYSTNTTITFANGQTVRISGPGIHRVTFD